MGDLAVQQEEVAATDPQAIAGGGAAFDGFADFAESNGYESKMDLTRAREIADQQPDMDIYRMVADNIAESIQADPNAVSIQNVGLNDDTRLAVVSVTEELDENTGNIYHAIYNNADGTYYMFAQQVTIDDVTGEASAQMIYADGWQMTDNMSTVKVRSALREPHAEAAKEADANAPDDKTAVEEFAEEQGMPISNASASSYISGYEGRSGGQSMVVPVNGSSVIVIERSYNLDTGESTLSAEFTNLAEGNVVTADASVALEIDKDIIRDNLDELQDQAAEENNEVQVYNPLAMG